jgi:hypothetical protein
MSLEKKLIKPESILIEKTALEFAAVYYEAGRSSGLTSKHKNAKAFAQANVEKFIPLAVNYLMDMLGSPAYSKEVKDAIYDAFTERANDVELAEIGIKAFENPFAKDFVSDKVVTPPPVIWNTKSLEDVLKISPPKLENSDGKKVQ